jgi:hypothetical protein
MIFRNYELLKIPEKFRPTGPVERIVVETINLPPMLRITNRVGVIFSMDEPIEST